MVTREAIRELVVRVILDNQEDGARPIPEVEQLTDDFSPLEDLEGFDSYSAMETALELSDLLGCEVNESIFLERVVDRRPAIGEIVERLYRYVNTERGSINGQRDGKN